MRDLLSDLNNYRVAQKVSHYQESSLNRIKTVIKAKFVINFD